MNTLATLIERKNDLINQAQAALEAHGPNDQRYLEMVKQATIAAEDAAMVGRAERALGTITTPAPIAPIAATESNPAHVVIVPSGESAEARSKRVNAAYRHYLLNGLTPNAPEQRDLATTADSTGAALVPQGFDTVWTDALRNVSPIATLVKSKLVTDGRPTKQVITDSTAMNLYFVAETGTSTPAIQTPAVSSQIPGTDALLGRVTVSWQEIQDGFEVETFLRSVASVVIGRGLEYSILTATDPGSNSALPNSLASGGLNAFAPVTVTTTSLASGISFGNLVGLRSSVDHAYAFGDSSGFLGSQSLHDFLSAQTDSTGRQLYKRDPNTNLLLIDGSPLYVAGGLSGSPMPAYNAANSKVVLFGDFSRAYSYNHTDIRFKVLNPNPETMTSDVLFYVRFGSAGLLSTAVAALKTAAS
jgi:HK97 family phage major capsid protein